MPPYFTKPMAQDKCLEGTPQHANRIGTYHYRYEIAYLTFTYLYLPLLTFILRIVYCVFCSLLFLSLIIDLQWLKDYRVK